MRRADRHEGHTCGTECATNIPSHVQEDDHITRGHDRASKEDGVAATKTDAGMREASRGQDEDAEREAGIRGA